MGWSEAEKICKNHPYHDQRKGVCPSCLRERLSQIYFITSYKKDSIVMPSNCSSSDSPSADPYSFLASSNQLSPGRGRHQRSVTEILGSISLRFGGAVNNNGLNKSRSIGFVSRKYVEEVKNEKKKKGFWSKLLHLKGKKEALMHSLTMKQRLH